VKPVYKSTEKVVVEQYDKIIKGGEQYVVKDPAEADKLLKKWFYTNLSRLALKDPVLLSSYCLQFIAMIEQLKSFLNIFFHQDTFWHQASRP